jgi:2-oxoglutarate ferredoxin oxidoreductase subunit gamma
MSGTKSGFSQPAIGEGPAPKRVGLLAKREFLEVRLAGTAEQGVMLIGLVLATAATRDHRYVAQTQTHGLDEGDAAEEVHCDVIISDDPVDFPELLGADLLIALSQSSADSHVPMLHPGGVLVYDCEQVLEPPAVEGVSYAVPFGALAKEAAGGGELAPELVALGLAVAVTGVVSAESMGKTLDELTLPGSREAQKLALSFGLKLDAKQWRKGSVCS